MRSIAKIEWNPDDRVISVPSFKILHRPEYLRNISDVVGVLPENIKMKVPKNPKDRNHYLNDLLDIPPSKWRGAWNAIVYNNYVKPL